MVNTLEYCICCDMTKQCLKEGIPHLSIKLYTQLAHTSTTLQHSKKPKQKIMIMKLGMVNTLEYCICCNMTKQCLKEGIPHLSIKLCTQLAYTSITVQHSKKPKQKILIMKLGMVNTLEHCIYIYYLPAGRSVLRKTVPEVLSTGRAQDRGHSFSQYGPTKAGK